MSITLFIPELSELCAGTDLQQRFPVLESLLAHADMQPAADGNAVLAQLFGLPADFGVAPFMRLADSGERDSGFYFRADPVHLAPDRDQVVMLPLTVLQVQREEAAVLVEAFNRIYGTEGYRLETPEPDRWYLRVPAPLVGLTYAPSQVAGRPVFEFMPQGEHGQRLRQLMNEVQMLFYEQPVNQARESSGHPAINSLWLWGGGSLPETPIRGPDQVLSDLPLVVGLSRSAGISCGPWTGVLELPLGAGNELIAVGCCDAPALTQLEQQLAAPLLRALRRGRLNELKIYPGNLRCYQVTRSCLWKFWHWRHPLPYFLCTA